MLTGTITIEMLTDWHIGSGTGRPGSTDRLVQRDRNNLPYIPAKSLTGIWRDGCELVAQGLDNNDPSGQWQQWVNWLFGEQQPEETRNRSLEKSPKIAQLSIRSAHFPRSLQDAFNNNVMLQNMTTFVKVGVKINPHTGSALKDHLRFEEMTRSSTILTAPYSLNLETLTPEQQQITKALLIAGASMVDRLGAKRRRGAGRCKMTVSELLTNDQAIDLIAATQGIAPALPEEKSDDPDHEGIAIAATSDTGWWRIQLEVTTQSPIIIHKRTIGNHQETQDQIPGTYFLPTILKELSQYLDTRLSNALIHGDIIIGNANPIVNGIRAEAVPFAIFEPKEKSAEPKIQQRIGEEVSQSSDGKQIKSIRQGYVSLQGQTLHRTTINHGVSAHNTIADAKQRPDSEVGGIYTYESIPAGLTFHLEVKVRDYLIPKTSVNPLEQFLRKELPIQIGRTKKDDYGNVKLKQIASEKIPQPNPPQSQEKGILTVWLLSDLLLRDTRLRPTTDPRVLAEDLSAKLGVTLTLLDLPEKGLPKIDRLVAFARSSRTESWQTKWGLPRPTLVGLSAGTVLQFKVTGTIQASLLKSLEISGLGERTAEGYGQLCFNPALLSSSEVTLAQKDTNSNPTTNPIPIPETSPEYPYAQLIERETWRDMIRRTAGAIAADPTSIPQLKSLTNNNKLTRSKLGTLRTLVDSLTGIDDVPRIQAVLTHMASKESWNGDALTIVNQLITVPDKVWECYGAMGFDTSQYRLTDQTDAMLKQSLWAEAVRILVDACIRAHKRQSEAQQENDHG
jgi:CRISPR-associated protein Csx10